MQERSKVLIVANLLKERLDEEFVDVGDFWPLILVEINDAFDAGVEAKRKEVKTIYDKMKAEGYRWTKT